MRIREERYNGVDPNPATPTNGSSALPTGNSPVSPVTPGTVMTTRTDESAVISPISTSGIHRTISDALTGRRKKLVKGAEIETLRDAEGKRIPLLKRAESERLERFEENNPQKRFSWED